MQLFKRNRRDDNERTRRIYAAYELAYTLVDFGAAVCFTIGSVMFFWKSWETPAIWLFTIGSVLFLAKPAIRLAREVRLLAEGDYDDLADRIGR